MGTYKIHADLDVDGEVQGTSLDINGAGDISGVLTQGDHIEIASAKRIRWGAGDAMIAEGISENYALEFSTYNGSSMTEALRLSGDNTATFTGNIAVGGTVLGTSAKFGRDADNLIDFATTDNQIRFRVNGGDEANMTNAFFYPHSDDGMGLGFGGNAWSDLFLASGAVINFNNGDVTMTHASNQVTITGGSLFFSFGNGNYNTVDGTTILDSEDNDLMSFSESAVSFLATTVSVSGTLNVAADITHTGDADTKISFGTNTITFTCGNTAIYTLGSSSATMAGILDITDTTDSSDATGDTGALRCEGGASIAKKLFVGSAITGSNDVIAFSDRKLKDNIETLDGKKVLDMRGVSFTRKDTGKESSGVIAQEIQEVAPELVHDTNGTLGVAYGNLVGYLIEAIKDQQKQIDELKEKCNGCSK